MIIKKIKKVIGLIIIMSFIFSMNLYASEDNSNEAINYIDNIREIMDIRTIDNSKELKQSAENHSKYMSINDNFSTIEESGNKWYRGRYSWDRAFYFNYFNPYVTEFISNNIKSMKEGIVDFINNPYSRIVFLDPLYQHIGMGKYEDMYTFDLGGKSRDLINKIIAIYPYDNMEDVPITWENNYKIDPYRDLEGDYSDLGLPITLSYYSDEFKIKSINKNKITLRNLDTDKDIKTKIILPQDDKYIDNSLIILPLESLEYNTTYEVTINVDFRFENKANQNNREFKVTFSTERKDVPLTRGKFTEYLVKALNLKILEPEEIFDDIDIKSNKAKYIYTAYKNELVSGFGDNTFRPDLNITREQAYTLLVRSYEKDKGEIILKDEYDYYNNLIGVSSWAKDYIKKAEEVGLITKETENDYKKLITDSEYQKIIKLYNEIVNMDKDVR